MSRYIDADALKDAHIECPDNVSFFGFGEIVERFLQTIDEQPTVDAVQVVRCGKCKKWNRYKDGIKGLCGHFDHVMPTREYFYCADGERKNKNVD